MQESPSKPSARGFDGELSRTAQAEGSATTTVYEENIYASHNHATVNVDYMPRDITGVV